MELKSITIKNYKSIKEITIPIESYGEGDNKSSTTVLVGLNESGKSSIVNAIEQIKTVLNHTTFSECLHKGTNENEYIEVIYSMELDDNANMDYQKAIGEIFNFRDSLAKKIKIKSIEYHVWINSSEKGYYFEIELNKYSDFYAQYDLSKTLESINDHLKIVPTNKEYTINAEFDSTYFSDEVKFKELLEKHLHEHMLNNIPDILIWSPKPEFIITNGIDMNQFKYDIDSSIPLKNIFFISGYNSAEKIQKVIDNIHNSPEKKAELIDLLSESITKYLNDAWPEHQINLKVNIDNGICYVHVEDKDTKYKFYNMSQRSDGFKQFISLLLTLSTSNSSKSLSNNIILLDEPETHLHPSGIKFMRDELLKIGKNNYVIIATHSHYMIDTTTPERHFIVSKEKMKTKIEQVDKNASMLDDQVLSKAFGISLFKELLPQNILIVEGGDDKIIISHCLKLLSPNYSCSIKSAGGASKVRNVLAVLANEQIGASALFDDDGDGRKEKNEILKDFRRTYTARNIHTLRDIVPELPKFCTIEDLLPNYFVKEFFEKEMKQDFNLPINETILDKIKTQCKTLKENKSQLDALKIKLSEEFINTFNTKKDIESNAPLMTEFVNNLIAKMQKSE